MKKIMLLAIVLLGLMIASTSCTEETITPTAGAGGAVLRDDR